MELDDPLRPVRPRRKERRPEVQGILFLTEARTRHDADAGGFKQTHAVEFVRGAVFGSGGGYGFFGEGYCWEEVHCALVD